MSPTSVRRSDTTLHELCKGFVALLSRSKTPQFPEESAHVNDHGNLPLHTACSFQASQDVVDALLKAYPQGASQPNGVGNLPLHQAAMWQSGADTVKVLLMQLQPVRKSAAVHGHVQPGQC